MGYARFYTEWLCGLWPQCWSVDVVASSMFRGDEKPERGSIPIICEWGGEVSVKEGHSNDVLYTSVFNTAHLFF